jgi:hypothetical protein
MISDYANADYISQNLLQAGKTNNSVGHATMLCVNITQYSPYASLSHFRTKLI